MTNGWAQHTLALMNAAYGASSSVVMCSASTTSRSLDSLVSNTAESEGWRVAHVCLFATSLQKALAYLGHPCLAYLVAALEFLQINL